MDVVNGCLLMFYLGFRVAFLAFVCVYHSRLGWLCLVFFFVIRIKDLLIREIGYVFLFFLRFFCRFLFVCRFEWAFFVGKIFFLLCFLML